MLLRECQDNLIERFLAYGTLFEFGGVSALNAQALVAAGNANRVHLILIAVGAEYELHVTLVWHVGGHGLLEPRH